MPRWARFFSCSFTGLLLSLLGFLLAAHWWEGRSGFWRAVLDFTSTPAFWSMVLLFALISACITVVARVALHVFNLPDAAAGLLAGMLIATAYVAFLSAAHIADWGGLTLLLQKLWPSGLIFAVPFALSGAFTTWLWDRLD